MNINIYVHRIEYELNLEKRKGRPLKVVVGKEYMHTLCMSISVYIHIFIYMCINIYVHWIEYESHLEKRKGRPLKVVVGKEYIHVFMHTYKLVCMYLCINIYAYD
jgi:hypothetical protein